MLRILRAHPNLDPVWFAAGASAGTPLAASWPGLSGLYPDTIEAFDPDVAAERCDVVFLALPHGVAAAKAPQLLDCGLIVVDLGADFRLKDPAVYQRFYKIEHASPGLLDRAVYGLVELNRDALPGADLIANPGCYPTAVSLAVAPIVKHAGRGDWLVADCISGVSGAGRKAGSRNLFCEVHDCAAPYGLAGAHRHTPEIEQTLGTRVTFTPHLAPMTRGMIATVHTPWTGGQQLLTDLYAQAYADEAMVVLRDETPTTADARGTNRAHVHVSLNAERGIVTVVSVIDNLVKGASGQAVQAMNVALGLDETAGLPVFPVLP